MTPADAVCAHIAERELLIHTYRGASPEAKRNIAEVMLRRDLFPLMVAWFKDRQDLAGLVVYCKALGREVPPT